MILNHYDIFILECNEAPSLVNDQAYPIKQVRLTDLWRQSIPKELAKLIAPSCPRDKRPIFTFHDRFGVECDYETHLKLNSVTADNFLLGVTSPGPRSTEFGVPPEAPINVKFQRTEWGSSITVPAIRVTFSSDKSSVKHGADFSVGRNSSRTTTVWVPLHALIGRVSYTLVPPQNQGSFATDLDKDRKPCATVEAPPALHTNASALYTEMAPHKVNSAVMILLHDAWGLPLLLDSSVFNDSLALAIQHPHANFVGPQNDPYILPATYVGEGETRKEAAVRQIEKLIARGVLAHRDIRPSMFREITEFVNGDELVTVYEMGPVIPSHAGLINVTAQRATQLAQVYAIAYKDR